jgi:PTS system cellobiose-specific IIC component
MQQAVPLVAISVYLHLAFRLVLRPDALLPNLFHWHIQVPDVVQWQTVLENIEVLVLMVLVAIYSHHYLKSRGLEQTLLPVLTNFIGTYFLFFAKGLPATYEPTQYLLVIGLTTLVCESFYHYHKRVSRDQPQPFAARFLVWSGIVLALNIGIQAVLPGIVMQQVMTNLVVRYALTTFLGLLLVSVLAPCFLWLGFALPRELLSDQSGNVAVVKNLTAILKDKHAALPYPTNLYSVYDAFSQFGGVGNTLALSFLLLFAASKRRQNLGLLSLLPSLFNQNQLLYFGLPIFLRPIMLVPMLLTSLVGTGLAYLAIVTHLINPAALVVPSGTPNLLLGFLGSNDARALLLVALIFGLSLLIYRPFLAQQLTEDDSYEK